MLNRFRRAPLALIVIVYGERFTADAPLRYGLNETHAACHRNGVAPFFFGPAGFDGVRERLDPRRPEVTLQANQAMILQRKTRSRTRRLRAVDLGSGRGARAR